MTSERTVTTTTLLSQPAFRDEVEEQKTQEIKVIKLKPKNNKKVNWAEDTVDNENMNKLKSNGKTLSIRLITIIVCCIYHKPRDADEQSSSTCSSDSFSGNELERSREQRAKHKAKCSKRKQEKENKCTGDHDHSHHHH